MRQGRAVSSLLSRLHTLLIISVDISTRIKHAFFIVLALENINQETKRAGESHFENCDCVNNCGLNSMYTCLRVRVRVRACVRVRVCVRVCV
jgi:hypothetical protein